ncbi:MAG: NUDIX hydrolase [Candidatus Levybacteria bacterium]|nr:NUDIX hydrolase [Candidatus Levybacteria bacterium]
MTEEQVDSPEMKETKAAAAVAIKDGKVLLVREEAGSSHLTGMLGIPSGRLDEGETDLDTAVREFGEETGLTAKREDFMEFSGNIFHASIPRKGGQVVRFKWHVLRVRNFSGEFGETADNVTPMWVDISELDRLQDEGKLLPNVFNAVHAAMKADQK